MRGITYIIASFMVAVWITSTWLMQYVDSQAKIVIVASFMLFSVVGSIAPDADIKGSLVRTVVFWGFFVPYFVAVVAPLRLVLKKNHRGSVLHSVIGITWSVVVVYLITSYLLWHYPAVAAAGGFVIGYIMHQIGDRIVPNQIIKTKNIKDAPPQN